jgi:hypothetical protein
VANVWERSQQIATFQKVWPAKSAKFGRVLFSSMRILDEIKLAEEAQSLAKSARKAQSLAAFSYCGNNILFASCVQVVSTRISEQEEHVSC